AVATAGGGTAGGSLLALVSTTEIPGLYATQPRPAALPVAKATVANTSRTCRSTQAAHSLLEPVGTALQPSLARETAGLNHGIVKPVVTAGVAVVIKNHTGHC